MKTTKPQSFTLAGHLHVVKPRQARSLAAFERAGRLPARRIGARMLLIRAADLDRPIIRDRRPGNPRWRSAIQNPKSKIRNQRSP